MMLVCSPLLEWITNMSLFYRAEGVGDNSWYEAAIVLYKEGPDDTLMIVDVHVVRGHSIANFKTESFTIEEGGGGDHIVGFYAGSYDRNGDGSIGASLTVGEVMIPAPSLS